MSCSTSDRLLRCLPALLLPLLAGCASLDMELPAEFLKLEDGPDLRAVTAGDARVWGREFVDDNVGPLAFWVDTLSHDLRQQRGYTLVADGEAKDGEGHLGRWLQCAATVDGERRGYLVAVFAWEEGWLRRYSLVRTLEFTAREEDFQRLLPSVRDGLGTLQR